MARFSPKPVPPGPPPPEELRERLGDELFERRRKREQTDQNLIRSISTKRSPFEFLSKSHGLIDFGLRMTFLRSRARRNARNLAVAHHRLPVAGLPEGLEGFRVLHIADMHFEFSDAFTDLLIEALDGIGADLTVCTGDYRFQTLGPIDACMREMERVVPHLPGPVYSVLGNHDSLAKVPVLEDMGVRVLLNEGVLIEQNGGRLWLAGIDDPHHFETDDLEASLAQAPRDTPVLLLAHASERYELAEKLGVAAYLCGHTHGGQVCLPGGVAVFNHAQAPRAFVAGPWRHRNMHGYTSRGSGCTGLEVRFHCPPEITVHTLTAAGA